MAADYDIRPFASLEEYHECVALQEDTWGQGFSERVSPAILKVAQILGGVAAGAYEGPELVGFVFGMTGVRDGELVHWSDMLAVRPGLRDSGLGSKLKWYQREQVLDVGVEKMHWTFDPLQSRNANMNFNKLGIVSREYARDMYGQTDSPLHRGIGTDRLIALWLLNSERVVGRIDGVAGPAIEPVSEFALDADLTGPLPQPLEPDLELETQRVGLCIPSDVDEIMAADLDLARAWRAATRAAFTEYMGRGMEVSDFIRGERVSAYVLNEA